MSADFHAKDIYCMCLPPGRTTVYDSAILLEEEWWCLCCCEYCISRTCSTAFEILRPTPCIPPGQCAEMPGWGDGPLLRAATPHPETHAKEREPSLLALGRTVRKPMTEGCKYSISCKVN